MLLLIRDFPGSPGCAGAYPADRTTGPAQTKPGYAASRSLLVGRCYAHHEPLIRRLDDRAVELSEFFEVGDHP